MKEQNQKHWKSLEELEQDPAFLQRLADEFPEFAPSRRDFLKLMGFSLGTVALVACTRSPVHKAIPFLQAPEDIKPGVANWYATTCAGCTAGCSLLVKNRDGRPIKVEGNPASPMTAGGVCAVGQASLLSLYDGSRLKGPSLRGSRVNWEELDQLVLAALQKAREGGGKVVFLSGTLTSPSSRQLITEFLVGFPQGEHVVYDPISMKGTRQANLESFGEAAIPTYRLDKAKVIVGVNVDFLGSWLSPVEFTRQYIQNRKLQDPPALSRHIQFESDYSLTGLNADRRIPILPSEEGLVVLGLLGEIEKLAGGESVPPIPEVGLDREILRQTARELWANRGASLVLCGSNDPMVQILVNALNDRLGNIGQTVDLDHPSFQKQGDEAALSRLIQEMSEGKVAALFIEGVNPVYDFPEGAAFQSALTKVPLSVSLNSFPDETAAACSCVAPGLTYLEAWNDAQPRAGLYHLAQPLIAPLFNHRSFQDSLLKWMGGAGDFYGYLKDYWAKNLFPLQGQLLSATDFWNHSLHDGVFQLPETPAGPRPFLGNLSDAAGAILKSSGKKDPGRFELVLFEPVALREGRQANNPWLHELPDPVTKLTWGNGIKISPTHARSLGLAEGDRVRLETDGKTVEAPVFLQPGLREGVVSLALGYGRRRAGKVGDKVGADAYPFLQLANGFLAYSLTGVALKKTGRREALATTQAHSTMEHRPIVKETTLADFLKNPKAGNTDRPHLITLWGEQWEQGDTRWGMTIDLNACTGCSACVISCQVENNVPVVGKEEVVRQREMHWMRIDRYYTGPTEAPGAVNQPMFCQHCGNAPCETVCPVLATVHSSDGLNQQVYNRCVGTRYCANNCPYKVRRFNWFDYANNPEFDYYLNDNLGKMVLNPDIIVRSRGVMEKCSMCIQRIQEGKLLAKQEGRAVKDGEIQTACQQSCPGQAIVFGNLKDPKSRVAQSAKNDRYYHVLEELNVRPTVGYLTKVRNQG